MAAGQTTASPAFRSQFRQAVIATEAGNPSRFEIDVDDWYTRADAEFRRANGTMAPLMEQQAVILGKRAILDEYMRSTRSVYVDQYRELHKIAARAKRKTRYEVIQLGPGNVVKKREIECTVSERIILAEQYERAGASNLRRGRYHRAVAALLIEAGMGQHGSLQDWDDRQVAGGSP
jgi:hypothetical protein